jgi:microcompartment protein CcmL/EutN
MPRTRTLIAAAAVAAMTATAGFTIANTAGASTTATTGTLTAASAKAGTQLSVTTAQSTIAAGQQDSINGMFTSNGSPEPHRVIGLYRYSDRLHRWRLVRHKLTNQAGTVKFDVRPAVTRKYMLVYHGNSTLAATRSGVVTVVVTGSLPRTASTLSITASATSIAAGGTTKISGVLTAGTSPVQHRLVLLRRYNPTTKEWVRVAVKRTGPQGVVFFVRAPSTTATFELVFPGGPRFAGSHSGTVTVTVAGQSGGVTPAPADGTKAATGSTT